MTSFFGVPCYWFATGATGATARKELSYDVIFLEYLATGLLQVLQVHVPNFEGLSGSEDRGGGDNSIQFINFGRVGDKCFKEWRQKIGGWKGG